MTRRLPGAIAIAVAAVVAGVAASGCGVAPQAASANGTSISAASLNDQLHTLQQTAAGNCLLELENPGTDTLAGQGSGGQGTYTVSYAKAVLDSQIELVLAGQYAASKDISVGPGQLATARSDLDQELTGEISQLVEESESEGIASPCVAPSGASLTGQELLDGLPASLRDAQVRNEAVNEGLLARGANLSQGAVTSYYHANLAQFTVVCVSIIVTTSQAKANQLVDQIKGGASFASVAKADSIDSSTAPNGGAYGCNYTLAQIEQTVGQSSVTTGQPLSPVEDPSSGDWAVFEVTSATVTPLSSASSLVRRELLQSQANVTRVSKELQSFAKRSDVFVDPRYGSWTGTNITAPHTPPGRYLLGAWGTTSPASGGPVRHGTTGSSSPGSSGSGSGSSGS